MQDFDPQWLFNGMFAVIGTLGGWLLSNVRDSIRKIEIDEQALGAKLQHMEVVMVGTYATREEVSRMFDNVSVKLDRIEAKLDAKADKNR